MRELLRLESVTAGYGEATVLEDVTLEVDEGDALAVLGRNGVGKSTLLLTLMGITRVRGGTLSWRGADLTRIAPHARAEAGLGWVPQERLTWPSLTVEEHLTAVTRPGPWTPERIYRRFPRLEERKRNYGNQLSGGEQQLLAIARALVVNPRLLLLDEPMEGLAPLLVREIMEVLRAVVAESGMAVIVVEQHARLALSLTRHAVLLERGRIVHRARSEELMRDPARLEQLLGVPA